MGSTPGGGGRLSQMSEGGIEKAASPLTVESLPTPVRHEHPGQHNIIAPRIKRGISVEIERTGALAEGGRTFGKGTMSCMDYNEIKETNVGVCTYRLELRPVRKPSISSSKLLIVC